jgi:hypothetical protein
MKKYKVLATKTIAIICGHIETDELIIYDYELNNYGRKLLKNMKIGDIRIDKNGRKIQRVKMTKLDKYLRAK